MNNMHNAVMWCGTTAVSVIAPMPCLIVSQPHAKGAADYTETHDPHYHAPASTNEVNPCSRRPRGAGALLRGRYLGIL